MLITSAKSRSARGAFHQPTFMSSYHDQSYSREWVWNSRKKLGWKVVGTGIVSVTLLQEFYVGYMIF